MNIKRPMWAFLLLWSVCGEFGTGYAAVLIDCSEVVARKLASIERDRGLQRPTTELADRILSLLVLPKESELCTFRIQYQYSMLGMDGLRHLYPIVVSDTANASKYIRLLYGASLVLFAREGTEGVNVTVEDLHGFLSAATIDSHRDSVLTNRLIYILGYYHFKNVGDIVLPYLQNPNSRAEVLVVVDKCKELFMSSSQTFWKALLSAAESEGQLNANDPVLKEAIAHVKDEAR